MTRIDLPGAHWAEVRDAMEVTFGERKRVWDRAVKLDAGWTVADVCAALLTSETDLGLTGLEAVEAMPSVAVDALKRDPAFKDGLLLLFPDFTDPTDPTGPFVDGGSSQP